MRLPGIAAELFGEAEVGDFGLVSGVLCLGVRL
jgi:hypothetical protein